MEWNQCGRMNILKKLLLIDLPMKKWINHWKGRRKTQAVQSPGSKKKCFSRRGHDKMWGRRDAKGNEAPKQGLGFSSKKSMVTFQRATVVPFGSCRKEHIMRYTGFLYPKVSPVRPTHKRVICGLNIRDCFIFKKLSLRSLLHLFVLLA